MLNGYKNSICYTVINKRKKAMMQQMTMKQKKSTLVGINPSRMFVLAGD